MEKLSKVSILFLFFSIFYLHSNCQQKPLPALTGQVVNVQNEGIPYAAVALMNDQKKVVALCFCDDTGVFNFPDVSVGRYSLKISLTGCPSKEYSVEYDGKKTDIGKFLMEEGFELGSVVVSAERKLIKSEVDRLVYDVEKDPDAKNATTMDILKKVPFVEVDKSTGNIKVLGEEYGFSILVNGKKSLLLSESNQYVAKALEANKLKSIELITSPDGKYIKQSAVINIVTRSSIPDGLVGEVSVSGSNKVSFGSRFGITSKIARFIYNLNYEYGYQNEYGSKTDINLIDYKNSDYKYMRGFINNSPGNEYNHSLNINASYDISNYDLVAINFKTNFNDSRSQTTSNSQYSNTGNLITREFTGKTIGKSQAENYVGGVNYQKSFKDNPAKLFTLSYGLDNRANDMKYDQITDALVGYTDNRDIMNNNLDNVENTIAADFYNPVSEKHSYYLTTKYVNRNYGSETRMTDLDVTPQSASILDNLGYVQQVGSLQGNYSYKARKFMLTADAAFEHTKNDIDYRVTNTNLQKNDDALLLNLRFTYRPTQKSSFILSLRKNSFRPDITYLNPYEDKSVPGQISKGNPELNSQKDYSSMLMYMYYINKRLRVNTLLSASYSDNAVQKYSYVDNDGILVTTYDNISKNRFVNFSLSASYIPATWINLDLIGRIGYYDFEYLGNHNSYWDPLIMFRADCSLWKGAAFGMQLQYANPNTSISYNIQSSKQHFVLNGIFSLSQKLGKHINMYLNTSNLWETYHKNVFEDRSDDLYRKQVEKTLGRTLTFSVVYNFGNFNSMVKSTKRTIQNTDRTKDNK